MSDNPLRAAQLLRSAEDAIHEAQYLTVRAYALKYGITTRTVRKWVNNQAVEFYRKGKRVLRVRDLRPDLFPK